MCIYRAIDSSKMFEASVYFITLLTELKLNTHYTSNARVAWIFLIALSCNFIIYLILSISQGVTGLVTLRLKYSA